MEGRLRWAAECLTRLRKAVEIYIATSTVGHDTVVGGKKETFGRLALRDESHGASQEMYLMKKIFRFATAILRNGWIKWLYTVQER